jgi:Tol biopolymer transport system component
MKTKYLCILIIVRSLVCKDVIAQSHKDYFSYKIVYTKYNAPSDYFDGSDIFLFDTNGTISCLSDFSKKSEMPKISSNGLYVVHTFNENSLIITYISNSKKDTLHLNVGKYIWHPDGKQIIYQDYTGIKAYNVETKMTRVISSNDEILPFCISTDGKKILCQQMRQINGKYLYQMFLVTETTTEVKTLDGPGAEKRFGSFSHDSKNLIYSGGNQDLSDNLYAYDIFNNAYLQLTDSNGEDLEAVYSLSGEYICFVSTRLQDSRGNYKLYVMKSDGSDQKMVYEKFATNIKWPKNSEYIYFLSSDGVFRIKPDGSDLLKIIDAGYGYFISDFDIVYLDDVSSEVGDREELPQDFQLFQNYPNPFNPTTTIEYQIPKAAKVKIEVFDIFGKQVETLLNKEQSMGNYKVYFDGSRLSSGIYFYKITANSFIKTKKMVLIK